MSPDQCKAARMLLGWMQKDLAAASLVSEWSIKRFEAGHDTGERTMKLIHRAYTPLVVFLPEDNEWGEGVRLRKGAREKAVGDTAAISEDSRAGIVGSRSSSPFEDTGARGALARVLFRQGRWFRLPRSTRRVLRAWLFADRSEQRTML